MASLIDRPTPFARHKVSELNRGGMRVLDEAAQAGVVLDATASRPELVMVPATEWQRLIDLASLGRLVADVLTDVAAVVGDERPAEPRIPWLAVLGDGDLREFAREVAAAARLSMETDNPEPLRQTLYAWKSTAEYLLAGARLSKPIDWSAVVRLTRPDDEED